MSVKTRLAKLEAASPPSVTPKKIDTWQKLIELGCLYNYDRVDDAQHAQLEPFKKKFEAGTFVVKGEGSDFRATLDILY